MESKPNHVLVDYRLSAIIFPSSIIPSSVSSAKDEASSNIVVMMFKLGRIIKMC